MMMDGNTTIAELEAEEHELVLSSFDQRVAWRLGSALTELAMERRLPVAIDIRRPGQILFRCALAGTTPDQDAWIRGKAAVVLRMEESSALVAARMAARGIDAVATGWLPNPDYAVAGGSFPIRVRSAGVVAAVTAAGLSSEDDHALVVKGLRRFQRVSLDGTND